MFFNKSFLLTIIVALGASCFSFFLLEKSIKYLLVCWVFVFYLIIYKNLDTNTHFIKMNTRKLEIITDVLLLGLSSLLIFSIFTDLFWINSYLIVPIVFFLPGWTITRIFFNDLKYQVVSFHSHYFFRNFKIRHLCRMAKIRRVFFNINPLIHIIIFDTIPALVISYV